VESLNKFSSPCLIFPSRCSWIRRLVGWRVDAGQYLSKEQKWRVKTLRKKEKRSVYSYDIINQVDISIIRIHVGPLLPNTHNALSINLSGCSYLLIFVAQSNLLFARPEEKKHAARREELMRLSFISEISLSIPEMNSSIKLISSSFLNLCKCSSLIRNEKSYCGKAGFFLRISNLSARRAINLSSIRVSKTSTSALFLIEIDIRTLLMLDSIRQCSLSLLEITIGSRSSLALSLNSTSG